MDSNNSQKYKIKNDKRILNINYTTAQQCEKTGEYKKAIKLYNINIKKFNDPLSKVSLANLYLTGKTQKIDNAYARKLLEESYNQGCKFGRSLLAYTLANGIGGKKQENKAYSMFLDEINENNPNEMVYLEIIKYMKKSKKNKKLIKSLKSCVTTSEMLKYKRQVSIDKFNNSRLGKIVNIIPNYISVKIDEVKEIYGYNKYSKDLNKLYDKANNMYEKEDYGTARRIYKRLALLGDNDSKIKYAKMCTEGIGGKVDIESAKHFYTEIINKKNRVLTKIEDEISKTRAFIKEVKQEKNSFRNSKIIKIAKEEIRELKDRRTKIKINDNYKEAYLQYGMLLVDNSQNETDLNKGIQILKYFANNGEKLVAKNQRLTHYGKQYNRRARIAINKLGNLFEKGIWKPADIEKERTMFDKFSISKNSKYTSYISDKMAGKAKYTRKIEDIENRNGIKAPIKYTIASLCRFLSINSIARKLYTKMCEKGDYRGAYSLAYLEHKGKGGNVDLESAKKHYRDYIRSTIDTEDKDEKTIRFYAVNDLATLHMEENDLITAIQLYKIATQNGNSVSRKHLKKLFEEGKWVPKTELEQKWVKPTLMEKVLNKPKERLNSLKEKKRNILIPKMDIKKPVAATIAAVATVSVFTHNSVILKTHSYKKPNETKVIDKDKIYKYIIGDKVGILKNNVLEESQIVDFAAYDSTQKTRIILDNQETNYKVNGFASEKYIEKIIAEKNISKDSIGMLYCVRNENDIKWVNPLEEEIILLKKYIDIKKEDDYVEEQLDYLV